MEPRVLPVGHLREEEEGGEALRLRVLRRWVMLGRHWKDEEALGEEPSRGGTGDMTECMVMWCI